MKTRRSRPLLRALQCLQWLERRKAMKTSIPSPAGSLCCLAVVGTPKGNEDFVAQRMVTRLLTCSGWNAERQWRRDLSVRNELPDVLRGESCHPPTRSRHHA